MNILYVYFACKHRCLFYIYAVRSRYRRIRQLVTHERTVACHPKFNQRGQLAEQQKVMEEQIPRLLSDGFDVGGAIMAMWRGDTDLEKLTAGIDPESAALVKLILHADDECYMEQHRAACEERDLTWIDPTCADQRVKRPAIPEGVPAPQAAQQAVGTQVHVAEMFQIVKSMASEGSPPTLTVPLRPMEWARLQRCAHALPHQAQQLGHLDPVNYAELAQRQTLLEFLKTAKLQDYQHSLRENLGLRLGDVPFVQPADLVAGGLAKEFHQKRFMRFAKKLPISPVQENRYDEEWIRTTEAEVNPEVLATAHAAHLELTEHPVDQHFLDIIPMYRRIRQLADPEYAMSTAARRKLRGRLCAGGYVAERELARAKLGRTDHGQAGLVIMDAIWQGDSLDEIKQRLTALGLATLHLPEDIHRLAELMFHADDDEFDDDAEAEDRATFCDTDQAEEYFQEHLVTIRRMRQLTFPKRAVHQHPSFHGDTPEEERAEVRTNLLPAMERRGWSLTQAVEKMWAGETRLKVLAAGADPSSTYVIKKMMEADSPKYAAEASKKHRQKHAQAAAAGDPRALDPRFEEKVPEIAQLMAALATRPVGNGSLEYERGQTESELFPLVNSVRPDAGDAILRIWAGERDLASLSANKPSLTRTFIAQILDNIAGNRSELVPRFSGARHDTRAVSDDAVARLVSFTGKSASEVRMCLEAAGGNEDAAAAMLSGA